ncbi:MAG: 50S ribosomal protein L11 methyltransferase [Thermomicrobiales bacterium]
MTGQFAECADAEWLELAVEVDHEAVEPVTELFARYGFNQGVVIEEPFTQESDGENLSVDPSRPVMVRTFVAAADVAASTLKDIRTSLWHLGQIRAVGDLVVTPRREEDWANAWKEHFRPVRVGRRVVVRPPWADYQPAPGEVVIELDPGMAFGTGTHPTTRLCMMALEDELHAGNLVFDVGTGSGVLAIAAANLGAERVDAVDNEPVAVRSARANVELNGVADRVRVEVGSAGSEGPFSDQYDLVLANIIARILIELVDGIATAVRPGGRLVLSGIIESREPAVRRAYEERGLVFRRRDQIEDWVALVYERPA